MISGASAGSHLATEHPPRNRSTLARSRDLHVIEQREIIGEINNTFSEEVLMPIPLTSNKPNTRRTLPTDLQEQIRSRAYEIYEQRNRTEGRDLDDWLQAEAEVTGTKNSATT